MRNQTPRALPPVLLLLLLLPLLFVGCGPEEQRTVNVRGRFQVEREQGRPDLVELEGRAYEPRVPADAFSFVWDAVAGRGAAGGSSGVMLTLAGGSEPDGAGVIVLTGMVLVLPLPLHAGANYAVTATFPPPGGAAMPMYWVAWGPRPLARAGEAAVALRTFDYRTIGMRVENEFVATGVTGSVQVLRRYRDHVELRLDIVATDAAGGRLRLHGDFSASNERYTPPIT
jgi:hypothetical protein